MFISWSGERSKGFAEALRNWLPKIINAVKPWLSSADIDKGARWSADVAAKLEASQIGVICLTPSNMHSDWILFEAGALSKTIQNTHVCPRLVARLEPSDVHGPLAQFQATRANRDEIKKLLVTINAALGANALTDAHLDDVFDVWWPKLDEVLKRLPPDEFSAKPHRPERDILEEILALVRSQVREPDTPFVDRMYTAAHAFRRVDRAMSLVLKDEGRNGRIKGWTLEKGSHQVNLKIETDSGNCIIPFPIAFQPMDDILSTIVERLSHLSPTSVGEARSNKKAPAGDFYARTKGKAWGSRVNGTED